MQIQQQKLVTVNYTLTDDDGSVLETTEGKHPLTYLHGLGTLLPSLEQALDGRSEGEQFTLSIPPERAFGEVDENLVQQVPRDAFQGVEDIQPDMQFEAQTSQGSRVVTVVDVDDENVTVDANHPLAGVTLNFDLKVEEVRDPTDEELAEMASANPADAAGDDQPDEQGRAH